jgi:hypothetical protein
LTAKLASFKANNNNNNNNNNIITIATRVDSEKYYDLKLVLLREKENFQNWISEQISNYLKVHGDGNPNFTLDHFEDQNFQACPAFFRPMNIWESYLKVIVQDEKRWKEFDSQLNSLLSKTNKTFQRK